MKISIVTPHAVYNYGAVLQAHALYNYLLQDGHDVFLQDFPPHKGESKTVKEKIYVFLSNFFKNLHKKSVIKGEKSFDRFIKQLKVTDSTNIPLYILGSDQVWNPNNLDKYFTLEFASESSKKISYAASMGVSKMPQNFEEKFCAMLNRLERLSVRETQTANEVKRLSGRDCSVDCDPTFLLTKEYWRTQEVPLKINKPYVLLYLLHVPKDINKIVKAVKKHYGCKPVIIDRSGFLHLVVKGTKAIYDCGPQEFLWLIDNAKAVITSSFHGTAFSIIFNKEFFSIVNPASPSRINNILNICGLTSRGIYKAEDLAFGSIDYNEVDKNLFKYIESSKNYLRESIGNYNNE